MTRTLLIGSQDAEHLAIEAMRGERPNDTDFWDGTWIICRIALRAGGFRAAYEAHLRAEELHRFNEGLKFMRTNLFGTAVLTSMEDWIDLAVTCGASGELTVTGKLGDGSGANALEFELPPKDQSYLPRWIDELDAIRAEFRGVSEP